MPKRTSKPSLATETLPEIKKSIPGQQEHSKLGEQQTQTRLAHLSTEGAEADVASHPHLTALLAETPDTMIAIDQTFHILDCNTA
ncbi:MAG TPA: hypothetical protein VKR42_00125, partial [Ktedonobacteraceae bacterium]|nr:hypothetical protein [Ktedonobacteraceae bacterium]